MRTTNYRDLLDIVATIWLVALGVWAERNRFGGTHDQRDKIRRLEADNADLATAVDELVATAALHRDELETRRHAAMYTHPTAQRRLHLVGGAS